MTGPDAAHEVRLATLDDAPAILRVLQAAFGRWPKVEIGVEPIEHLRWKMSPPGVETAHTVALIDGEIVATGLRWVARLHVGDELLVVDNGVDQAVLPGRQGQGLGGVIVEFGHREATRYSDLSLGSGTNHPGAAQIFSQFDPTVVRHPLAVWSRTFGPRAFVATQLRGGGRLHLARSVWRAAIGRLRRRGAASNGARIEEFLRFDQRAEELWGAVAPSFDFAFARDAAYLNWRYLDPRAGTATALAAVSGDRLLGYAVFKRSGDAGNVLDLVTHPEHSGVAVDLIEAGLRRLREAGVRAVNCWLPPGHPAEPALRATGFLPAGWTAYMESGGRRRGHRSEILDRLYAGTARGHLVLGDIDFV